MQMSEEPGDRAPGQPADQAKPGVKRTTKASEKESSGQPRRRAVSQKPAPASALPSVLEAASAGGAHAAAGGQDDAGARRIKATNVTITQGGAAEVEAESISVTQGGIGAASAEDISVEKGGIGRAEADDIAVRMGGIGIARGERISVELGAIGLAAGSEVSMTQGFARAVLARDVHIRQGGAQVVVAANVTFEGPSGTFVLLARKVEGNVRTVLDWRGALAAGAALGIAIGLLARRKHD
jgi:hypothetical protein